jgi:hypothetical protein
MAGNPIMMPWMPHLSLWSSPLYNELYVGLCRALAAPWFGHVRPASGAYRAWAERSPEKPGERRSVAPVKGWRLLDSRQSSHPIGAGSLAELGRAVRSLKSPAHDGADSGVASPGGETG